MNQEKKWIIESYTGLSSIHLDDFDDVLTTFKENGFTKIDLLSDFIDTTFLEFNLDLWVHFKRKDYVLDLSNHHGGIFLFYCENERILLDCLKKVTDVTFNILKCQEIIKNMIKE